MSENNSKTQVAKAALFTCSGVDHQSPVGKMIELDKGKLVKTTLPRKNTGKARVYQFGSWDEYHQFRIKATAFTELFSGQFVPTADGQPLRYGGQEFGEQVAATKGHLQFRPGPTVLRLDTDYKDADEVAAIHPADIPRFASPDECLDYFEKIIPELIEHDVARRCSDSTSAMIYGTGAKGKQHVGAKGYRTEILIADGLAVPHMLAQIHGRCIVAGDGWGFVDRGARVQLRSPVDMALKSATQPEFCAPYLGDGLTQKRRSVTRGSNMLGRLPDEKGYGGSGLHGDLAAMTHDEKRTLEENARTIVEALKPSVTTAKEDLVERLADEQIKGGMDPVTARRYVAHRLDSGVLVPNDIVHFKDGRTLRAGELLMKGAEFDGADAMDPTDPDYGGGRPVARFYWNDGERCGFVTMAHGGKRWLKVTAAKEQITQAKTVAELIRLGKHQPREKTAALEYRGVIMAKCRELSVKIAEIEEAFGCGRDSWDTGPTDDDIIDTALDVVTEASEHGAYMLHERLEVKQGKNAGESLLPLPPGDDGPAPAHIDNWRFLTDAYGFKLWFNVYRKDDSWSCKHMPAKLQGANLNAAEGASTSALLSQLISQATMNNLSTDHHRTHVAHMMMANTVNPVRDYLYAMPAWDGKDRTDAVVAALGIDLETTSANMRRVVMRWLIQAVAAAHGTSQHPAPGARPTFEYVLVLIGGQGVQKTSALEALMPRPLYEQRLFQRSLVLDVKNKDSVWAAIQCWIGEFGELEATFKKAEVTDFKAFMSRTHDTLRRPYLPGMDNFRRMTVFCASVNSPQFLNDATGARRFLPYVSTHRATMPSWSEAEKDQLWAQALQLYQTGTQWWPTAAEQAELDEATAVRRTPSLVQDRMFDLFDWEEGTADTGRMHSAALRTELIGSNPYGGPQYNLGPFNNADVRAALENLWQDAGGTQGKPMYTKGGKDYGYLVPRTREQSRRIKLEAAPAPAPFAFTAPPTVAFNPDKLAESTAKVKTK